MKVESTPRPDGMRYSFVPDATAPNWWEMGPVFFALNTNKRGITLDFGTQRGLEVLQALVDHADVLIENFTPRVLDSLGLDHDHIREVNPGLVIVRMPAFGVVGPWKDRTGFAQTIEQTSGLAWTRDTPTAHLSPHVESATRWPVCTQRLPAWLPSNIATGTALLVSSRSRCSRRPRSARWARYLPGRRPRGTHPYGQSSPAAIPTRGLSHYW